MSSGVADPLVLLSYVDTAEFAADLRAAIPELGDTVTRELRARGVRGQPVNAAAPTWAADEATVRADGVLVLGGVDIDPAVYGQAPAAENLFTGDRDADEYEARLVRRAADLDKPVLGICRGSQVINVAFGGTLIQDLGNGLHVREVPGAGGDIEQAWTNHEVAVQPGTRLAALLGAPTLDVRVGHHQAVDEVGGGLVVAALASDGVVEAIEGSAGWIVGVQWHPEERRADPAVLARLLDGFVQAVRDGMSRAQRPARDGVRAAVLGRSRHGRLAAG
jgi:putative glutamine amidotransferase